MAQLVFISYSKLYFSEVVVINQQAARVTREALFETIIPLIFIVEVGVMVYMVYCGMELLTESCLKFASVGLSKVDTRPRIIISKG